MNSKYAASGQTLPLAQPVIPHHVVENNQYLSAFLLTETNRGVAISVIAGIQVAEVPAYV